MKSLFVVLMMLNPSVSESCLFQEEMLCSREVSVTLNYHEHVRPCPCVVIVSSHSALCDSAALCIEVLFEDDAVKCVDWRSYPLSNALHTKCAKFACLNSSLVTSAGPIRLICSTRFGDADPPVDILFGGVFSAYPTLIV